MTDAVRNMPAVHVIRTPCRVEPVSRMYLANRERQPVSAPENRAVPLRLVEVLPNTAVLPRDKGCFVDTYV